MADFLMLNRNEIVRISDISSVSAIGRTLIYRCDGKDIEIYTPRRYADAATGFAILKAAKSFDSDYADFYTLLDRVQF